MKSPRFAIAVSAPAILLVALTGCFGDGGGGTATPGAGAGAGGTSGCLTGKTWTLDVADMATQLGDNLSSHGLNVVSSTGTGSQTWTFERSGHSASSTDLAYAVTVNSSDSLVMTLTQTHTGDSSGDWALDGDTVHFTNWDPGDYAVANHIAINGVEGNAPITIPDSGSNGLDMTVECSGSTLSTKVAANPFTQHWSAG